MSNVEILTARLNAFEHRREIFNVLQAVAAQTKRRENRAPSPDAQKRNREAFHQMINSRSDPALAYSILLQLASSSASGGDVA